MSADLAAFRGIFTMATKLTEEEKKALQEALEDPDVLLQAKVPERFVERLTELNLVAEVSPFRDPYFWIDVPPPERDTELGIGKYYAWQTPLHREAVRVALSLSGG